MQKVAQHDPVISADVTRLQIDKLRKLGYHPKPNQDERTIFHYLPFLVSFS